MPKPRNDRDLALTKFCRAMEEHRRTEAGRVRTAKEFVAHFFPYDEKKATDQLFLHMPNDVRGPVLAKWGIRGSEGRAQGRRREGEVRRPRRARGRGHRRRHLRGGRRRARSSSTGSSLADWWTFWRHGKLTGVAIQKALATAREVGLIDDKWFLENVQGRGGKLKGTDVLCDTLSKDQIVAWLRRLHETGDGSPSGIVAALGWETILAKTAQDALLFALDQFARKTGLVAEPARPIRSKAVASDAHDRQAREARRGASDGLRSRRRRGDRRGRRVRRGEGTGGSRQPKHDSGFPVAIPDIPAVDGGDDDDEPPSIPSVEERSLWSSKEVEESPKLAEARAAMMQTLISSEKATAGDSKREAWDESEIPAKPSSLEWPEPPPVVASQPLTNGEASPTPASDPPISLDDTDLQKASSPHLPVPNPPPVPSKPGKGKSLR